MDRRQPALRWSAVTAGAVVAVALWVVLQLLGMGAGLAAIDMSDAGSLRSLGLGTTVWSFLAPMIALFAGGMVAGRLAHTFDQRVGAAHGIVVWAIASIAGVMALAWIVSTIAGGAMQMAYGELGGAENVTIDPSLRAEEIQEATKKAGKILLGAGMALLLSLVASALGGWMSARRLAPPRRRTQEVPVVPPPSEPPADAPHVNV